MIGMILSHPVIMPSFHHVHPSSDYCGSVASSLNSDDRKDDKIMGWGYPGNPVILPLIMVPTAAPSPINGEQKMPAL
jgi:hypothetical protein